MASLHQPANSFRTASSIRALRDKDDNSFRKARNLGTIKPGRSFSFNFKNSVEPNDSVDYFKFKIRPGVNSSDSLRFTAQGAGINMAVYGQIGSGKIVPLNSPLTVNSTFPLFDNNTIVNDRTVPITLYYEITPFDGQSTYKVKYTVTP